MKRESRMFAAGMGAALAVGWLGLPRLLYQREAQPLQFSHVVHTETAGQSCTDCHRFDADGRFLGIPALETCAACHSEPLGDSADEQRLVQDFIRPGREIPWRVYARQPDLTWFPHAQHVRLAELACERCHGPQGRSDHLRAFERDRVSGYSRDVWGRNVAGFATAEWDGMKMGDCSSCHREHHVTESCLDCHK